MNRERFSRVGEWDRTFARRVEDFKQVHACRDHGDFGPGVLKPEREARPEKADTEEGKREEEEVPAAPDIDSEDSGESKDPVEDPGPHGC